MTHVRSNMKNFHYFDDFFHTVVDALIIALAMETAGCATIDSLRNWIGKSDSPKPIQNMESVDLGLRRVHLLRANAAAKVPNDALGLALRREKSE